MQHGWVEHDGLGPIVSLTHSGPSQVTVEFKVCMFFQSPNLLCGMHPVVKFKRSYRKIQALC